VTACVSASTVLWAALLVFANELPHGGPVSDCTADCPGNALQLVQTSATVSHALNLAASAATALIVVGAIVLLVQKAASEPLVRRRALTPLIYSSIALAATFGTYSVISEAASPPGVAFRVAGALTLDRPERAAMEALDSVLLAHPAFFGCPGPPVHPLTGSPAQSVEYLGCTFSPRIRAMALLAAIAASPKPIEISVILPS